MAKKKSSRKPSESPPFEEALSQLEGVVERLESEKLPLEEMVGQYELGMKLLRSCQKRLTDAEKRVEHLSENLVDSGEEEGEDEADDADFQQDSTSGKNTGLSSGDERKSTEDNDEIRLF